MVHPAGCGTASQQQAPAGFFSRFQRSRSASWQVSLHTKSCHLAEASSQFFHRYLSDGWKAPVHSLFREKKRTPPFPDAKTGTCSSFAYIIKSMWNGPIIEWRFLFFSFGSRFQFNSWLEPFLWCEVCYCKGSGNSKELIGAKNGAFLNNFQQRKKNAVCSI